MTDDRCMSAYDHVATALETLLVRVGESARDLLDLDCIVLGNTQGHDLAPEREPWANALLRALCTLKAQLAGDRRADADDVAACLGETPEPLCGGRCVTCGYADVRPRDVEAYAAARVVRAMVPQAVAGGEVETLVEATLRGAEAEAEVQRAAIREAIARGGVEISGRTGPLEHCPSCEGDLVIAYRWRMNAAGGLEATRDNVSLRLAG